ncbi:MAG: hypothetical protein Q8S73_36975 [Deltaproteobacteria bacterium]|nr:hypothetical protein [Myxococcales bacterium]MDP3219754.1 hypothetical protein [Deltaproteobacteria bacterium]
MSATHTAVAALRQAVAPALPQGDPANLALARELLDNRALLQSLARGALFGEGSVTIGGDATTPSLATPLIEAAVVRDPNVVWRVAGRTAGTVTPGALTASTIHYLYLRADADGVYSYVVSTTAPTGLFRITGNELQRLVCAFATGLLGFPLPAVVGERSGRYIASSGRAELVALAPGATIGGPGGVGRATTWTAVSLATLVPPWATTAWVMARVKRAAADGGVELRVRRSSADGGHLSAAVAYAHAGIDSGDEKLVQVPLLSAAFEYQLTAALTDDPAYGATFTVVGWE